MLRRVIGKIAGADPTSRLICGLVIDRPPDFIGIQVRHLIEKRIEGGRRVQCREHGRIVDVLEAVEPMRRVRELDSATAERVLVLDVLVGQPHELVVTEQVKRTTDDEFVDRVAIAGKLRSVDRACASTSCRPRWHSGWSADRHWRDW